MTHVRRKFHPKSTFIYEVLTCRRLDLLKVHPWLTSLAFTSTTAPLCDVREGHIYFLIPMFDYRQNLFSFKNKGIVFHLLKFNSELFSAATNTSKIITRALLCPSIPPLLPSRHKKKEMGRRREVFCNSWLNLKVTVASNSLQRLFIHFFVCHFYMNMTHFFVRKEMWADCNQRCFIQPVEPFVVTLSKGALFPCWHFSCGRSEDTLTTDTLCERVHVCVVTAKQDELLCKVFL